jgi:hypothetical protein
MAVRWLPLWLQGHSKLVWLMMSVVHLASIVAAEHSRIWRLFISWWFGWPPLWLQPQSRIGLMMLGNLGYTNVLKLKL